MSSSITRRYLRLQRSAVHPLSSFVLPFLFLLSADQILRLLMPAVEFFPQRVIPLLLFAGTEEAVMGNLLFKERASFLARVRELVAVLAIVFAILLLLLAVRSGRGLHLSAQLAYPLLLVLLQWLLSSGIHSRLRERELLLGALEGKRGAELRHTLRDSSYQAGATVRALGNIRALIIAFQITIFLLLVGAGIQGLNPSLAAGLIASLHALGGLLFLGMTATFTEEQFLLGSGAVVPLGFQRRRLLYSLSILGTTAALVVLASRNSAIFPLSALIALLEKLGSLLRFEPSRGFTEALKKVLIDRRRYYDTLLRQPSAPLNPLFVLFTALLRRLFITLLGTGLFLFLVSPLFSQDFLDRLRELKPLQALRRKLRALTRFCLLLWLELANWFLQPRARRGLSIEELGAARADRFGRLRSAGRTSLRKKVQMGRVLRAFVYLLRWGESLGISYFPFNTPQEYTQRLAAAVPAGNERLAFVVDVFEEVMFSTHLVSWQRISRYYRSIRALRRLDREPGC